MFLYHIITIVQIIKVVGLLQVSYAVAKTAFEAAHPEERHSIVIEDLINRRRKGFLISYVG
jgi:hypothetical protein